MMRISTCDRLYLYFFSHVLVLHLVSQVLKLITHLLMQRSLSQTAKSVSTVRSSTPPSGALGGDEPTNLGERATDVAVLAPLQLKALECLEGERDLHESNLLVLFTSS